jgi:cation transport ATPase
MLIAAATVGTWLVVGGDGAVVRALATGVAVLIIACPCAMGLAVPDCRDGRDRAAPGRWAC